MHMNNNADITLCSFAFTQKQRLCLDGTSAGAEDEM